MTIFVIADTSKVIGQRGWQLRQLRHQLEHSVVAEPRRSLRVEIEEAVIAKRSIPKVLADITGHLAGQRTECDQRRCDQARGGRLAPADVLLNRTGPPAQGAGDLPQIGSNP